MIDIDFDHQLLLDLNRFGELTSIRDIPSTLLRKPFLSLFWQPNFANYAGIGWIVAKKEISRHQTDLTVNMTAIEVVLEALDRDSRAGVHARMENIPGFEGLSQRQLLLHYLARIWGCGASRSGAEFVEDETLRKALFDQIDAAVKQEWNCSS